MADPRPSLSRSLVRCGRRRAPFMRRSISRPPLRKNLASSKPASTTKTRFRTVVQTEGDPGLRGRGVPRGRRDVGDSESDLDREARLDDHGDVEREGDEGGDLRL